MYLKSIEINGFKSFAQRTVLEFGEGSKERNSITAIVGPNGSGKSNISDAIRWVMGEQKVTNLRAKKSDDVIFSGSDAKGKLGLASVTLVLDNSDGRAPIEYEELSLTRRLYRTGESEYLINGNNVRLLDLQILLAKAQFGQGSYSVIGQGMIDRLILQSASERKSFFDEATGIKEFQIKRHQTGLKLFRTKENINQAEMLLNEVEPRLKTLSRQVKKLEQRKEIEITLRERQDQYYTTLWQFNQSSLAKAHTELKTKEQEYLTKNKQLTSLQEELAELARSASRQDVFEVLQKDYQGTMQKKNNLERERAILAGKLQAEFSKVGRQDIGWTQNKVENLSGELKNVIDELRSAEKELLGVREKVNRDRGELDKRTVEKTTLRGKISILEQQTLQKKSEQNYFQFTGLRAVQAILAERQRFGAVFGAVAQLGRVEEKYQLAMDVAAGGHISSLVVGEEKTAQACVEYLRANQLGVATFLPINKIQPRFVPRDINEILSELGVLGLATDFISCEDKFANIFSYIFGNTVVVEDMNVARQVGVGRVRMVTLAGDIFETSGSIKGGWRRRGEKGLSFFQGDAPRLLFGNAEALEEDLSAQRRVFGELESDCNKQTENLQQLESEQQILRGRTTLLEEKKRGLDQEIASLKQELSLSTMNKDEYAMVMKEIGKQKEVLEEEIASEERAVMQAQTKIDLFNEEEEKKKQRIFDLQDAMQTDQQKLNIIVDAKNLLQVEIAKWETKQEDLGSEVYQEMQTSVESIVKRGSTILLPNELEEAQVGIQKLKYQLSLIGGIEEGVFVEYEETRQKHEGLTTQLADLSKALIDLEKMIVELDGIMKKKRDKAFKEIKKEFARFFSILFDGGKADLVEIYSEEVGNMKLEINDEEISDEELGNIKLETGEQNEKIEKKKILSGIEIVANPPGKKIMNIQSLSGGERTLTSLALVCSILRINPSPFVVLDEVEAALDEANSLRLSQILGELAKQSQFILITHNRATMHAADALYGVTMGGEGVSHLVSVRLGESK